MTKLALICHHPGGFPSNSPSPRSVPCSVGWPWVPSLIPAHRGLFLRLGTNTGGLWGPADSPLCSWGAPLHQPLPNSTCRTGPTGTSGSFCASSLSPIASSTTRGECGCPPPSLGAAWGSECCSCFPPKNPQLHIPGERDQHGEEPGAALHRHAGPGAVPGCLRAGKRGRGAHVPPVKALPGVTPNKSGDTE